MDADCSAVCLQQAITSAAKVDVEPVWANLLAKALAGKDVKDLLSNVGGGGAAPVGAAPAAAAGGDAPAAAEEKKEVGGFGLDVCEIPAMIRLLTLGRCANLCSGEGRGEGG